MMSNDPTPTLSLTLRIASDEFERFTTLLQSGIKLPVIAGTPLGIFITDLPGFNRDYISENIQTIFLDGNALDDMEQPLTQSEHVVALSAAMPGLAGAIFRKNSLCAALRTQQEKPLITEQEKKEIIVSLKLFNSIALEKGGELLQSGGIFSGKTLLAFFKHRPFLLDTILSSKLGDDSHSGQGFLAHISENKQYYFKIHKAESQESK